MVRKGRRIGFFSSTVKVLDWKVARLIRSNFTTLELMEMLFIAILGLVVFSWYSNNLLINTFDYGFSFSPDRTLQRMVHLWDPYSSLGMISPRSLPGTLPNNLYYSTMHAIGISLHWSQALLLYIILVGAGISMFLFYRALGFGGTYRHGALFAAIVYMFSPIASTFIWNQFASNYYSYCFLPLIGAMVAYGIRGQKGPIYVFAVAGIWTILVTSSYMNPANAVTDWLLIGTLIVTLAYRYRSRVRSVLVFSILLLVLWLVINLVWLVPSADYAAQEFAKADVSSIGVTNLDLLKSNSVPIYQAALQTGYWALYGTYLGDHWYSWSGLAASPAFILSCLIIAMTSIGALFIRPRQITIVWLGGLSLFSLIMINGYYPPFGDLLISIFNQVPDLYAFRSLYQRFGPMLTLCYSLMFGFTMGFLVTKVNWKGIIRDSWRKVTKKTFFILTWIILVTLAVSCVALPYFTGEIIYQGGNVIPSARVQVPSYYAEANSWINNQSGDFRILPLPFCRIGYASYNWENGFWGGDPSPSIFDKVVLTSEDEGGNGIIADIIGSMVNYSHDSDSSKMLSILNVRYVLLHEDANWEFIYGHSWWITSNTNFTQYKEALAQANLTMVATFGKLHIYENPAWRDIHYYQTNSMIAVVGGHGAIKNMTTEQWFDISKTAFINVTEIDQISSLPFDVTDVYYYDHLLDGSFSFSAASNYTVHTYGADETTIHHLAIDSNRSFLIFSETYNTGWEMDQNGSGNVHFSVNMLFNGWILTNGSNSATLEFIPQKCIAFWIMISAVSIIVFLAVVFFVHRYCRLTWKLI